MVQIVSGYTLTLALPPYLPTYLYLRYPTVKVDLYHDHDMARWLQSGVTL